MNQTRAPWLTICINTRNRSEGLARLLASLAPQVTKTSSCKIVVVNDGSHDARYAEVIRDYGAIVSYYPLDSPVGIPAGRNIAVSHADGDFLVFVDDDCVVPSFWLDWLMASLQSIPDIDVIAGVTKPLLPDRPGFFARVQAAFGLYPNPERRPGGMRFVTANLAIRRSLFDKVGGFRSFEGGPASGSDTDLADRVCRVACGRRIDHDWYVLHDVGEPVLSCMKRYWRYGYADTWLERFVRPNEERPQESLTPDPVIPFLKATIFGNIHRARAHFPTKRQQIRAGLLASLIQFGYFRGRRAGLRAKAPASSGQQAH